MKRKPYRLAKAPHGCRYIMHGDKQIVNDPWTSESARIICTALNAAYEAGRKSELLKHLRKSKGTKG